MKTTNGVKMTRNAIFSPRVLTRPPTLNIKLPPRPSNKSAQSYDWTVTSTGRVGIERLLVPTRRKGGLI
jgi:hypothetical protein